MGQGVARDLIKQEPITAVVLGDLYPDPKRLTPKLRESAKVTLLKMDVKDHKGMVQAFKDTDVVINCAGPFYKTAVPVAKAAVEARVNYIDICDDYEGTEILFNSEIDKMARNAGITVLTGMGSDPGTNNVLVKWYANRLDRVDEVYLYWVVAIAELAGAAWDHSLHMTLGKIPQYINDKLVHVEGGTEPVAEEFLEPLGTCHVRYVGHPQPFTIPRYVKGVKNVIIKGALIPLWVDDLIKEQKDTGFLSQEPKDIHGTTVTPYDLTLKLWETIPCFTLTQKYQNVLAKKLAELVPCSEMSIFLKTGSDATTASVRIARAYTGKIKVMRCGYHGWHDWCVEMKGGIPSKFYKEETSDSPTTSSTSWKS